MKRQNNTLRIAIASLLVLMNLTAWGEDVTVTWIADNQGYSTGQSVDGTTCVIDSKTSIKFNQNGGANPPKYYSSGNSVRLYPANTMTVIGEDITKIVLTFGSDDKDNTITANQRTYNDGVWSGLSEMVTFTVGGSSGHRKIASVSITYMSNGGGGGGEEPPGAEKIDTVPGINALKKLSSGTETCLYLSPESNARVLYANGGEVYLRDNGGAVCLNIDYALFNPKPAHNQHVAGWITGRYSEEGGLPQLLATENTNTHAILFAEPVTEPDTEPEYVEAEEFGAYYADWVLLKDLHIIDTSDEVRGEIDGFEFVLNNRFGLSNDLYIMPKTGDMVNVSGIAYPEGNTDYIAPVALGGIPATEVTETNGIEELGMRNEELGIDGVIHNLMGQRVEHPVHGIYIVNGKKIFIK